MTTLELVPDQVSYVGGDNLTGKVRVSVTALSVKIKKISIDFTGKFELSFKGNGKGSSERHTAEGVVMKKELIILSEETTLEPGERDFPFDLSIPKNAPGSCSESIGKLQDESNSFYELGYQLICEVDLGHVSLLKTAAVDVTIHEAYGRSCRMLHESKTQEYYSFSRLESLAVNVSSVFSFDTGNPKADCNLQARVIQNVFNAEDQVPIQLAIANEHRQGVRWISVDLFKVIKLMAIRPRSGTVELKKSVAQREFAGVPSYSLSLREIIFDIPADIALECTSTHINTYHLLRFRFHKRIGPSLSIYMQIHIVGHQNLSPPTVSEALLNPITFPPSFGAIPLFSGSKVEGTSSRYTGALYYIDIYNDDKNVAIEFTANGTSGVMLRLRKGKPSTWLQYTKKEDYIGDSCIIMLDSNTRPKLESGRYFLTVYGTGLRKSDHEVTARILLEGRLTSNEIQSREYSPYFLRNLKRQFSNSDDSSDSESSEVSVSLDMDEENFGVLEGDGGHYETGNGEIGSIDIGEEGMSFENMAK